MIKLFIFQSRSIKIDVFSKQTLKIYFEFEGFIEWLQLNEFAQSCPTLCDPVDCSLSGSSVHGILQARILEWVAISFSRDLPDPGIEPWSLVLQVETLPSEPPGKPNILIWRTANDNVHIVFQYLFLLILFYLFTVGNII